jgi:hypothetical protein
VSFFDAKEIDLNVTSDRLFFVQNDEWTCVVCSFASALHDIPKYRNTARKLYDQRFAIMNGEEDSPKGQTYITRLVNFIQKNCKGYHLKEKVGNVLSQDRPALPVSVMYIGGGILHGVAIRRNWLYDSAHPRVLFLGDKTIDVYTSKQPSSVLAMEKDKHSPDAKLLQPKMKTSKKRKSLGMEADNAALLPPRKKHRKKGKWHRKRGCPDINM